MKIDKYTDKLFIRFDERGESFSKITTLPHYKTWVKVLKYLKKRGFEIKTPKYYIEQNYAKAKHKVAYKGNVVLCLECGNQQIKVEYGDVKNLWKDWEYNFWSLTDSRSESLTYLESKKIELEVNKLLKVFHNEAINNKDVKLSPTEFILNSKKESCHSRDKSKLDELGLDGVKYQMSEYDLSSNSKDRDKKLINCGDLKYFYDYTKKLCCGKVYHNLNNMWWVLTSEKVYNISSFNLFDFNGEPKRKELTKEQKINRIEKELRRCESKKDYVRCISISNHLNKLKSTEKLYHIWSLKHKSWWGSNNSGYTNNKKLAGVYLESNVLKNQSYYNNESSTKAVLI